MFKCACCEVLKKENEYLKLLINSLHEKLNIPMLEEPGLKEDYHDDAPPAMNKEGFEPAEIHDD